MEDIKFCEHGNNNSHRCDECYIVQLESERDNLREAAQLVLGEWEIEMNGHLKEDSKPKLLAYEMKRLKQALTRPTQNQTEVV